MCLFTLFRLLFWCTPEYFIKSISVHPSGWKWSDLTSLILFEESYHTKTGLVKNGASPHIAWDPVLCDLYNSSIV